MQTQIRQWLICSQNFFQRTYSPSTRIAADYPYNVPRSNAMFTPLLNESSLIKDVHSVKPIFSPGPDGIAVLAYSDTVPTHLFLKTACFFFDLEGITYNSFVQKGQQVWLKQLYINADSLNIQQRQADILLLLCVFRIIPKLMSFLRISVKHLTQSTIPFCT